MEPTDAVLARLDRIEALDRSGAGAGELLAELRGLLGEAESSARDGASREPEARGTTNESGDGEEVVERLRAALARDIIER